MFVVRRTDDVSRTHATMNRATSLCGEVLGWHTVVRDRHASCMACLRRAGAIGRDRRVLERTRARPDGDA